jgi:hypothetical protein
MTKNGIAEDMRRVFASFDAGDVPAFAAFMTDDLQLRLGNADATHGKAAFIDAVNGFLASIARVRHESAVPLRTSFVGSVNAVTETGSLLIASASGSQLGPWHREQATSSSSLADEDRVRPPDRTPADQRVLLSAGRPTRSRALRSAAAASTTSSLSTE